jgi:hypothetical protein
MEYQVRCWDLHAKKKVYGFSPVFIFDVNDRRNKLPNDPDYSTADKRWKMCPASLQKLFTKAFTDGLREPGRRVTEGEWQDLFLQLKDGRLSCPRCKAVNLWEHGGSALSCWHCMAPISIPLKLAITHPGGKHYVLLSRDATVLRRHIDPRAEEKCADELIGRVVQNPANPQVWGIRNLTASPWVATTPDNKSVEVAPQKALPLSPGVRVNMAGRTTEILA